MFQKLGLKDVFIGLWQRRIKIIIIAVLALVVALGSVITTRLTADKTIAKTQETVFYNSITYKISSFEKDDFVDRFTLSQKARDEYLIPLNSVHYIDYLFKNIDIDNFQNMLIIGNKEISKSQLPDKTYSDVYNALVFSDDIENPYITLTFKSYDKVISEEIINKTTNYIQEVIGKQVTNTSASILGTTIHESKNENNQTSALIGDILKQIIKKFIVFLAAFEIIYFAIVVFSLMINPKVNRKKDLDDYFEVPIWEIK